VAAEIINLRKARKAKARVEADARAAENRVRFGRSKAEREVREAEDRLSARRLDGHQVAGATSPDGSEDA
jgi:hypothetical protein